jgi:hypothetical protein
MTGVGDCPRLAWRKTHGGMGLDQPTTLSWPLVLQNKGGGGQAIQPSLGPLLRIKIQGIALAG